MFRPAPLMLFAGTTWTVLVMAAPLLGWPALYEAAHLVCHQAPQRSFQIGPGAVAVCARCLGLYIGALIGAFAAIMTVRAGAARLAEAPRHVRFMLLVAAVPTLLTLPGEWVLHWPVTNIVRFAAAVPFGAAAAWVVARALEVDWRT